MPRFDLHGHPTRSIGPAVRSTVMVAVDNTLSSRWKLNKHELKVYGKPPLRSNAHENQRTLAVVCRISFWVPRYRALLNDCLRPVDQTSVPGAADLITKSPACIGLPVSPLCSARSHATAAQMPGLTRSSVASHESVVKSGQHI